MSLFENNWFDFVIKNPDKHWDYSYLSANPNITWENVKSEPEKPWDFESLSENPNITWSIVQ